MRKKKMLKYALISLSLITISADLSIAKETKNKETDMTANAMGNYQSVDIDVKGDYKKVTVYLYGRQPFDIGFSKFCTKDDGCDVKFQAMIFNEPYLIELTDNNNITYDIRVNPYTDKNAKIKINFEKPNQVYQSGDFRLVFRYSTKPSVSRLIEIYRKSSPNEKVMVFASWYYDTKYGFIMKPMDSFFTLNSSGFYPKTNDLYLLESTNSKSDIKITDDGELVLSLYTTDKKLTELQEKSERINLSDIVKYKNKPGLDISYPNNLPLIKVIPVLDFDKIKNEKVDINWIEDQSLQEKTMTFQSL